MIDAPPTGRDELPKEMTLRRLKERRCQRYRTLGEQDATSVEQKRTPGEP
jgi:hypothetical protein